MKDQAADTAPYQEAIQNLKAGRFDVAADILCGILRVDPKNFDALHTLGIVRSQQGQFEQAERLIADAILVNSRVPGAFYNRGCALLALNRREDALLCFDSALAIEPDHVGALNNRGGILIELERYDEALLSLDKIPPARRTIHTLLNRGVALFRLARFEDAVRCFDEVIAFQSGCVEAWAGRGEALIAWNRLGDALSNYDRALAADPSNIRWLVQRGTLLAGFKRYAEAARDFAKALEADPDYPYVRGTLVQYKLYCCDWDDFDREKQVITSELRNGRRVVAPMANALICESDEDQLRSSRIWIANEVPQPIERLVGGGTYRHKRIRLAYVSPELGGNPVATQIAGVFERHDKSRFETIMLSFGREENNAMRARVAGAFEHYIDIRGMSDREVGLLLRDREVDIAVDLAGLVGNCRPTIFALRPVPIQVNYLGFPSTTGADYIDYIVADRTVIPENRRSCYSENIVYLPDTYMPADSGRRIAERTPSRAEAGLPRSGFVFCTFNNVWKITPAFFDIWMRLLQAIDGSVFWLPKTDASATKNLCREAEERNIDSRRLVFAPFLTAEEDHLARLRLADLFLDFLPYNAHSTACDALWAGLPVLTCLGNTFAGRVAASILQADGLPELVTKTLARYEALALKLAREPDTIGSIKVKLERNRDVYPLFDTLRYTRHLEAAFMEMVNRRERGEAPAGFAVDRVSGRSQS